MRRQPIRIPTPRPPPRHVNQVLHPKPQSIERARAGRRKGELLDEGGGLLGGEGGHGRGTVNSPLKFSPSRLPYVHGI
ncbi:MAG: hypothetical protein WD851_20200, partial [Pirellulales bacterium]